MVSIIHRINQFTQTAADFVFVLLVAAVELQTLAVKSPNCLGFLQIKRQPFMNPGFGVSPRFFLPASVVAGTSALLQIHMCGLFANTVYLRD